MNTVVRVLNLMHNHYFRCQMGNGKKKFGGSDNSSSVHVGNRKTIP